MTCSHCEMRVKKALMQVEGVQDAEVSHLREKAIVTLAPEQEVSIEALTEAVEAAGYTVEPAGD